MMGALFYTDFNCRDCGAQLVSDGSKSWCADTGCYANPDRKANHEALVSWAEANIPEMECRGDSDCDHCIGMQILNELK
jgi:hypothetical protein